MRAPRLLLVTAVLLVSAVPPRPAVVHEAGVDDGRLRWLPPVVQVEAAPGGGALIPLQLVNGTEHRLDLSLDASTVEVDPEGAPRPTGRASPEVAFTHDELQLGPGEVAELAPAVNVPTDGVVPAVLAVRASTGDQTVSVLVGVAAPGSVPRLELATDLRRDGDEATLRTTVSNRGDAAALTSVRSVVRLPVWGRLLDEETGPLVVPAGASRDVTVRFRAPLLPGPYRAEVVAAASGRHDPPRASDGAVLWRPRATLLAVAALLVLISAGAWMRARRRSARAV